MQKLKRKPLLMRLEIIFERLIVSTAKLPDRIAAWPRSRMMSVLTVLFLLPCVMFWISGCTTTRVVRPPLPPQAEARVVSTFDGKTWRDVLYYVVELRSGWQACESDKAAIRYVYLAPVR